MKDTVPPPTAMTATEAAISAMLLMYRKQRIELMTMHNACPPEMKRLSDQLWSWISMLEVIDGQLRHILVAYRIEKEADASAPKPALKQQGATKVNEMHYRNGREARNGDQIVQLEGGKITAVGVLNGAQPGNDFCNGYIAATQMPQTMACLCDCMRVDDLAEVLATVGLDKRPQP